MLRGLGRPSGLALGALLRAHPDFAPLTTDALHDWLPAALDDPQSRLSVLLRENGFVPAFNLLQMTYSGGLCRVPALPFSPYRDDDYDAVQELISRSFYELRRTVGLSPHYMAPSQETRCLFAQHAADLFTLRQSGRIIAFAAAFGGAVDYLCVDDGHRGQGLGTALVMHCVNHILRQGADGVRLCVIEQNTAARALYRKLGFRDCFTTYLFRKDGM